MSGFSSIVGFMFSFFVVVLVFFGIYYTYQVQIIEQQNLIKSFEEDSLNSLNYDYSLNSPFYSSGRMGLHIDNTGRDDFVYKLKDSNCFDFFVNSKYVSKDDIYFGTLGGVSSDYRSVEVDKYGISNIKEVFDFSIDNRFKSLSCDGLEKEFLLEVSKYNWWSDDWSFRNYINVENVASEQIVDYQVLVELDLSNFDFTTSAQNELRFVVPLQENFVLDLTFDDYLQTLDEYSKYLNTVNLGSNSGVDGLDPSSIEGIVLDALYFDGVDDYVRVSSDVSLEPQKSLTYAAWVKWNVSGNALQYIFVNGDTSNSLAVVNDGGINDELIQFSLNIDGSNEVLYSNTTLGNDWHFVAATYDGANMRVYLDSILVGINNIYGEIVAVSSDNYIGFDGVGSHFFGIIDEVKFLNLALFDNEIEDLYYNDLRFRELDFFIVDWDASSKVSNLFVKVPSVGSLGNVSFEMYYDNKNGVPTNSDIEAAFSYPAPRGVGYVVSERISGSTGLNIFSLYDDNEILVDTDFFVLDEQVGTTLASGSVNVDDEVFMKYLAQVEGQASSGGEIIVPISWAGTNFYTSGMRNNPDRFCMLSPYGNANVDILDNGVSVWSGVVGVGGSCVHTLNIGTTNNLGVESDIPILVSSYGDTSDDSIALKPATTEDLYGVPTGTFYMGVGASGATGTIYESDGSTSGIGLGAYGSISDTAPGSHGDSPAYRLVSDGLMGALQQADGDGVESTVFGSIYDMGVKFGSHGGNEYVIAASPYSDANCTTYNALGVEVDNVLTGVGANGVYLYAFDISNNNPYLAADWKFECDKLVWPIYEDSSDDETNLFSHMMMRQYIYPEPVVVFN
ncbi:MAG: LamG domain-containing protein [Candidatus Woesearchaeota archaeon]|jgi:hypothetical protein|nr:LamG domain-containing protein [Candidatus Woesearchaeota archaeon]